ncbi:alpha/beta hydrolase [Nocardioides marinquilinus]|uniref:Alpha/beta hydrolase n=1 Tax=Nocardioides marinquilinus TaxID=1210400 RepID=A0ABP9PEK8_9ACTN
MVGVVVAAGLLSSVPGPARALDVDASTSAARTPAAAAAPRSTAAERQVARVATPRLRWERCGQGLPPNLAKRLTCATPKVPLDYDRPRGAPTQLFVARLRAEQPARRIGTLFVNPGGPGGSAAGAILDFASALGPRVRARFDVVGVDPRGVGGSGITACSGKVGFPPRLAQYPLNREQATSRIRFDDRVRRACAQKRTPLVDHASTADVARDMDLIRRAVGDPKLTYYGVSYGSYLGATYARLFPNKVRALVVDAVLDPVAWSTGNPTTQGAKTPFTTRLRSGYGAYEALTAAWTECDRVGKKRCALAGDALGKWKRVLRAAKQGRLGDGNGSLAYQDVVGIALGSLYSRFGIPSLASFVADLNAGLDRSARTGQRRVLVSESKQYPKLLKMRRELERRGLYTAPIVSAPARRPATTDVLFNAVTCSDSVNPRDPYAWERAAKEQDRTAPWFGRLWTWSSSPCARQGIGSSDDAFQGPWRTGTSTPLLVVGNTHDPATPISGARKVNTRFRDSVLLTWDGWGHAAIGQGGCVTSLTGTYLVTQQLPDDGTVCRQPKPLFR